MSKSWAHSDQKSLIDRRLARRHRAEQRFRLYGIMAIVASVGFLVFLLISIIMQATPAFTAHRLTLTVPVIEELADPLGDRSEVSLRAGSYNRIIQLALQDQFPNVQERARLRELFRLYSPVNSATLLRQVVENPDLVGQNVELSFPISDDADLYLKGLSVNDSRMAAEASADIVQEEEGLLRVESGQPVFQPFLNVLRDELMIQLAAAEARVDAAREATLDASNSDEEAAALAQAERAQRNAASLRERLNAQGQVRLNASMPSLFLAQEETVLRVVSVSQDGTMAHAEPVTGNPEIDTLTDWTLWIIDTPSSARRLTDRQIIWTQVLSDRGLVTEHANWMLFTNADSGEPELAGIRGALIGSVLTMIVTMALAVPIGVGAAIYLEEYAPKNRITDFIEVNINNLAAVPSIVFGLLGLAVFINVMGMPRSAPIVGGLVLALMTLPTVIISSRAALKAVPPSVREAAYGVGASRTQAIVDHVLPLALPGMLTGSIIGLAQALGETAPLLMIGMVAFIADPPTLGLAGMSEPATVMPVQIFLWSSGAERAFEAKTAAAILVLLAVMIILNAVAIYLRRRFERRW